MNTTNQKLRDELISLSEHASKFGVSHSEIASTCGISYDYLRRIRLGTHAVSDNSNELLQSIIDVYRKEVRNKLNQINKF